MTAPSIDAAAALDSRFDIVLVDVHPELHWEPRIFEQARFIEKRARSRQIARLGGGARTACRRVV